MDEMCDVAICPNTADVIATRPGGSPWMLCYPHLPTLLDSMFERADVVAITRKVLT